MKIALLTTSFPRFQNDEAGVFVGGLVDAYNASGISGVVIVPHDNKEAKEETLGNFEIYRYKYGLFNKGELAFGSGIVPNLRANPLLLFQIPGLLIVMLINTLRRCRDVDYVHAQWIISGFVAWINKIITGVPYIITLRGEDLRVLELPVLNFLFKPTLKNAKAITSVNKNFCDKLINLGINRSKIFTVLNGVSLPNCRAEETQFIFDLTKKTKEKIAIFVGTVIPRKRVHLLVDAFCSSELNDWSLLIIGRCTDKTYLDSILQDTNYQHNSDRILFLGAQSHSIVGELLNKASIYVSASEFEGRSNSINEALFCKLPVVASRIESHAEVIKDGVNGTLCEPRSESIISAVKSTYDNREYFIKNITNEYSPPSWEESAQQYVKILVGDG